MKVINFFFLMLFMMFFGACSSCNTENSTEPVADKPTSEMLRQQEAWDKVMVIHDEVMPKMSELNKTQRVLKENLDSITDEALKNKVQKAVEELQAADDGMWDWMHDLKQLEILRKEKSADEIMTYLNEQLIAISKVQKEMLSSMENGEKILTGLKTKD